MTKLLRTLFVTSLRLFPIEFRKIYGVEMKEIFADRIQSLSPLDACITTLTEILDVALSAIRVRLGHAADLRPATLGMLGTIVVAAMITASAVERSPAAAMRAPLDSIDFNARDPAGEFTLAIRHGRPVGATIDRVPLPRNRLIHSGDSIRVLGPSGRVVLALAYYHDRARIEWQPRSSVCRGHAVDCTLLQ
jgi:hypothetical protein